MLKLLDAEDPLEHFIQLVLAENELGGSAGCNTLLVLAGILLTTVDGVELGQPGAKHRLLAQAVDLGQAAHAFLDVLLKDLTRVVGRAAAALDHARNAVTLQKHLEYREKKSFVLQSVLY